MHVDESRSVGSGEPTAIKGGSMLNVIHGDLFASDADAIVNAVNCVGVMGAGLARKFATRYPSLNVAYREACAEGKLRPGSLHAYRVGARRLVINFPTKDHWRNPSQMSFISDGLDALVDLAQRTGLTSIAVPALGCGLGGLALRDVQPLLEQTAVRLAPATSFTLVLCGRR